MSRINYRNYPILEFLDKGFKNGALISERENPLTQTRVLRYLQKESKKFNTEIAVISDSFLEAASKSGDKLDLLVDEFYEDCVTKSAVFNGTFIYDKKLVLCYHIDIKKGDFKVFRTDYRGAFHFIGNDSPENPFCLTTKSLQRGEADRGEADRVLLGRMYRILITTIMFKKYAKVEIIESKANSKTRQFGCKYMNETDLDIQYLDSKWFTTLVNSTGFSVRGHFRLQPKKKDGEWTKELIWIDEHEKRGYNRQAGILR